MSHNDPLSYRDAGVDIDAKTAVWKRLKERVAATHTADVIGGIGGFGGLFRAPRSEGDPILVASADGVGTKLKVAAVMGRYDTLGHDIVNHCVNDILVQGARPLFFMDYIALGQMEPDVLEGLVRGLADACALNAMALLGGETAELPGIYAPGDFDLAGFIVGVVERDELIDGSRIRAGDALIGLESSGLHTNGYSLAQKVLFERCGLAPDSVLPEIGRSLGEELLEPHRSYLACVRPLVEARLVHGMAHITGGGFADNIERVLPEGVDAVVRWGTWPVPPVFDVLRERGPIALDECLRTFNMGVGLALVIPQDSVERVIEAAERAELRPNRIGEVVPGNGSVRLEGVP